LHIHRLSRSFLSICTYLITFIPEVVVLWAKLRLVKPDLVHCNGSWQYKGILAAALTGTPVVWHLNDTHVPPIILRLVGLVARKFATGIVYACERTKLYYNGSLKSYRGNKYVIQAPVDTSTFRPSEEYSRPYEHDTTAYTVLTVGNVNPAKGLEQYIDMAAKVELEPVVFAIVGRVFRNRRTYWQTLKERAGKARPEAIVLFDGIDDVRPFLAHADVYVCSSRYEGSPMSVWEAMAMALPVVSNDVGDVKKFLDPAYVVPVGNAGAAADKVARFLKDGEQRRRNGLRNREIATRHLSLEACVKGHYDMYTDLPGGRVQTRKR
jgi:glycosyltransferase involved in cell wall biosynthesis